MSLRSSVAPSDGITDDAGDGPPGECSRELRLGGQPWTDRDCLIGQSVPTRQSVDASRSRRYRRIPVPTPKLAAFLAQDHETPFLVVDLDVVAERFRRLAEALPGVRIFYAVKANPAAPVLRTLVALGSAFDVASPAEIDACLDAGAATADLSFGNTIKKARHIADAHRRGITRFAVDAARRARQGPHPRPRRRRVRAPLPRRRRGRLAAVAQVRLRPPRRPRAGDRRRPRTATAPACPSTSARSSARPRRGTTPWPPSTRLMRDAARRRRADRRSSTSAAASRRATPIASRRSRPTAAPSTGRWSSSTAPCPS